MLNILTFILRHPINQGRPFSTVLRFLTWQIRSRVVDSYVFNWIESSKLIIRNGMTGATGNIYCGLHEYVDMAFFLHAVREEDTFLDIGANIGSYTVLATKVCGATSLSFEPDPITANHLKQNVEVNEIKEKVTIHEVALGNSSGEAQFTKGLDTVNHIAKDSSAQTRTVILKRLDDVYDATNFTFMKLDVEGYELEVLSGAGKLLTNPYLVAIETELQDKQVIGLIKSFGFKRYYYDPVARKLSLNPIDGLNESNALLLRSFDFVADRLLNAPKVKILKKLI